MYERRTVAVIIPAYNEQDHVREVIQAVPGFVDRIYPVDDASTDNTWRMIRETADRVNQQEPTASSGFARRVVPVRHQENQGAGGAVVTGYEHALADGIDVIAVMDGDGQMDPSDLDRIIEPVATGEANYAKGNRLHRRTDREAMSRWRLFGNALLTMLTRIASGYWEMSDPQNGYTAISREALEELPLDRLYPKYGFLNHVLVHLNANGERIADVSHRGLYGDEASGIRYRQFVPGLSNLLARSFIGRLVQSYVLRRFHPLVVCYVLGAIVFILGVAATGAALVTPGVPTFVGGVSGLILGTLGTLLVLLGASFDVQDNADLVVRRDPPRAASRQERPVSQPTGRMAMELASDGGGAQPESGTEEDTS